MATSTANQEVDKKFMYGRYDKSEDARSRFASRIAHKAADLPMEDDVQITNTKTGVGAGGMVGIAAAAGLPGIVSAAILGYVLSGDGDAPLPAQPQSPAISVPDTEYDVLFFDKDGKLIDIPRHSVSAAKE